MDQGEWLDLDQAGYWISASCWTRTWSGYLTGTGLVTGSGPGLVTFSELFAEDMDMEIDQGQYSDKGMNQSQKKDID